MKKILKSIKNLFLGIWVFLVASWKIIVTVITIILAIIGLIFLIVVLKSLWMALLFILPAFVVIALVRYAFLKRFWRFAVLGIIAIFVSIWLLAALTFGGISGWYTIQFDKIKLSVTNLTVGDIVNQNNGDIVNQNNKNIEKQNNDTVKTQNNPNVDVQNNDTVKTQNNKNVIVQNNACSTTTSNDGKGGATSSNDATTSSNASSSTTSKPTSSSVPTTSSTPETSSTPTSSSTPIVPKAVVKVTMAQSEPGTTVDDFVIKVIEGTTSLNVTCNTEIVSQSTINGVIYITVKKAASVKITVSGNNLITKTFEFYC